jgi:multidrug resistance efflux pump
MMQKSETGIRSATSRMLSAGLALAATGVLFASVGCSQDESAKAAAAKKKQGPSVVVSTKPIRVEKLSPRVIVVGSVTAQRTSIVASGANGIVDTYTVSEGEWVPKGKILSLLRMKATNAELDQARSVLAQREAEYKESLVYRKEEVDQARAKKDAAEVLSRNAAEKLIRAKQAFDDGALNMDALADAEERSKQTAALFAAAKAEHDQYKAGPRKEKQDQAKAAWEAQKNQVAYLEAEKEKRTTLAPFDGFVVKEHSYVGQWLAKGDPVVTLARLDEVDVIVNVDQSDIRHVLIGETAEVNIQNLNRSAIEIRSNGKSANQTLFEGTIENESAVQIVLVDDAGKRHAIAKDDVVSRKTVPWVGTVSQIISKSDWKTGSRGFPVKVRIRNRFRTLETAAEEPGGKRRKRKYPLLKEGMIATVTFTGHEIEAYLVHKDSIVRSTNGTNINVFQPSPDNPRMGNTFQMRVKTGIGKREWIQVSPNPANPGEPQKLAPSMQVVTDGAERLTPVQANVLVVEPGLKKSE